MHVYKYHSDISENIHIACLNYVLKHILFLDNNYTLYFSMMKTKAYDHWSHHTYPELSPSQL